MGFLDAVTPAEMEIGRTLSLVTMVVLIFVGYVPALRAYAHYIRFATVGLYLLGILGFLLYFALFR